MIAARRRLLGLAAFSVFVLPTTAHAVAPDDFHFAVTERMELYREASRHPDNVGDALNGQMERANQRLEAVVPDAQRTPIDYFILGNLLFNVDPDRSFEYHRRALQALPGEPSVAFEMALQYHRFGDCENAAPLYQFVVSSPVSDPKIHALLAHCLVRLGRYSESVEAWRASDHGQNHTAIDFAIHDVFGERLSPLARHNDLVRRFRSGETTALHELLENAIEWRTDWWNGGTNWAAVDAVSRIAEEQLGDNSPAREDLRLVVGTLRETDTDSISTSLRRGNLILEGGRLPDSSYVAYRLIIVALTHRLVDESELATRFLEELKRRARSPAGDIHALILVQFLLAATEQLSELPEFGLIGWHQLRIPDDAALYLAGKQSERGDEFTHEDEELLEAIRDFPESPRLALLAFNLALRSGATTPEHAARLIDAEFQGLHSDPLRYSYTLYSYFRELEKLL